MDRTVFTAPIKRTVYLEIVRSLLEGPLAAGSQSVALIILIKGSIGQQDLPYGDLLQAIVFGSAFLGMAASLFYLYLGSYLGLNKRQLVSIPLLMTGMLAGVAAFQIDSPITFTAALGGAFFFMMMRIPIMTSIHHELYPSSARGRLASYGLMAQMISTSISFYAAGVILDDDIGHGFYILLSWCVVAVIAAATSMGYPTKSPVKVEYKLRSISVLPFKERWFGYILLVWFIFGFANLWIMPLRVKFALDILDLKPSTVTLFLGIVPEVARFSFLPIWARLFDRFNFIVLRMAMNAFMAAGVAVLFNAGSVAILGLGAFLHAIGFSGGRLAWALWVTKMTPKERSAEYMAVHVFWTGVRGGFGPMIGAVALGYLAPAGDSSGYATIAWISTAMILLSIVMLIPVIPDARARQAALESQ